MPGLHALHKILMAHVHPKPATITPGEFLQLEPDVFAVQIATNVEEVDRLEADLKDLGVGELPLKHKIFPFLDHGAPAPTAGIAAGHKRWRDFYKKHGIAVTDPGAGISHLILTERGIVVPGCIIALRDSHTPTMGAVGAFAMSLAGGTLSLFAIGRYFLDVPNVALVKITGRLNKGVFGRDVALHINGKLGQRGLLGRAVEFGGSYVRDLSMDMRFTLCNMGTEAGAMASYVQPDDVTLAWVKPRATRPYHVNETDVGYGYTDIHEFDVSALGPQVAAPSAPDNVRPLGEVEGRHIDQAFLGSCASGRLEDIAAAAAVMRGHKVHPDVRFIVTPGSREVLMAATRLGYIDVLNEANAIVTSANCGACPGLHGGILAPGEVAIACNTRNFPGRMGPNADIYLASPASVAASAIEGKIANPAKYLQ
jgi:3-isopropylmalate/(R)-2-methylmalate dehydratase large subunit